MEKRQILRLMLLLLLICNTFVTINMNTAIISMAAPSPEIQMELHGAKNATCPNTTFVWIQNNEDEATIQYQEDTFKWSSYEKRLILSAYHWLCWLSILPGSVLAQKYGSKIVVGYTLCISAVMSSSIPFLAKFGTNVIICVRMLQGVFSFIAVPGGIMTIIGNWSSKGDRGRFLAMILAGSSLGVGLGSYIFGYIGHYFHWKYIFHLTSLCGIVWTLFWYLLISDNPSQHPTISTKEKNKIMKNRNLKFCEDKIPVPWRHIITSVPVHICNLTFAITMCNFFVLITFIPLYLQDTYGFDSNKAGIVVSLPQFISPLFTISVGWFTDYFVKKQWMTLTQTRKLYNLLGLSLTSIPLVIMTFLTCNLKMIIILYIICTISRSFNMFGAGAVPVDISPKFCGILEGIMGTVTEIITLAFSIVISYLSKHLSIEEFWNTVFISTAILGLIGIILFSIWGSAEVQPWDQGSRKFQKNNEKRVVLLTSVEVKSEN